MREIDKAIGLITVAMMDDLLHGEDIELTENFTLSKHSEMDAFTLMHTEDWEEVASVLTDGDKVVIDVLDESFFK